MKIWWVYLDVGTGNYVHYNHGVGQIDTCLRRAGHTSELLYLREHLDREAFLARFRHVNPDAVFFPINTHQWIDAPRYARWIREESTIPRVFGGIHGILDAENVIADPVVDVLCVGEGEQAMVEWCEAVEAGYEPADIANLWFKRADGFVERNALRPLIEDLDALPIDDRAMWDHDRILRDSLWEVGVMGGRGCPFSCTYCANSARRIKYKGLGKFVRMCSPEHMIAMVEKLAERIPFRKIFFEDDVFTMDHEWVRRFCALYRQKFSYPFKVYIHAQTVTREILQELKDAGCYMVMAGVEAGSERLRREVLDRRMTNEELIRVFAWCDEIGLQTWTFNIVGFPGETEETIQELFALHRKLRPNGAQCSIFYPYPGTALYDRCRDEGLLTDQNRPTYFEKSVLDIRSVGRERLERAFWEFRAETLRIKADKEARGVFDLAANLAKATIREENEHESLRLHLAKIEGDERLCLLAHPRSDIAWRVNVEPGMCLRASIALDPLCIGWGGKGAQFVVVADGKAVFRHYLDPKENPNDNRWLEIVVDLSAFAEQTIDLNLQTQPHGSGELTGAWALWAEPHLAKKA